MYTTRAPAAFLRENPLLKVVRDDGEDGTPGGVDPGNGELDPQDTPVITCEYDGLNRRIEKVDKTGVSDVTYDYYYNTSWQVLEVRRTLAGGSEVVYKQYVCLLSPQVERGSSTGDCRPTGSARQPLSRPPC